MQVCLSLKDQIYTAKSVARVGGFDVAWEAGSYAEDDANAKSSGGFFDLSFWNVVRVTGPDASDYLNRMTTVAFKSFPPDRVQPGAFLTGKAGVVALGSFLKTDDGFLFLLSAAQGKVASEHIEKFHFAENLTVTEVSDQWALFGLWNPSAAVREEFGITDLGMPLAKTNSEKFPELAFWTDELRKNLRWCLLPRDRAGTFLQSLRRLDVPLLGQRLFEYYRIEAGLPEMGAEVSDKDIILEANYEAAVSRNKGCYPGQEVVERIFTYGQVNRKLIRVRVSGDVSQVTLPLVLNLDEKAAATLMSVAALPEDAHQAVGLAYVRRAHWERQEPFPKAHGIDVWIRQD